MKSLSPLRYPGGKAKLYDCVKSYMVGCGDDIDTYIEPFAGGAGIAIAMLLNKDVKKIVINDLNVGIYSFWKAICESTEDFLRILFETEPNMETYLKQKDIYTSQMNADNTSYSIELGFATFFLNRTNYSGILDSGPIGGYSQHGKFNMTARYNKVDLANKIQEIAKLRANIEIYNMEILQFNHQIVPQYKDAFIYYDPPYYIKGKKLYTNFLQHDDHQKIHESIKKVKHPWLLTYDNVPEILDIYSDTKAYKFCLSYTLNSAVNRKGTELMFSSDPSVIDKIPNKIKDKINIISL